MAAYFYRVYVPKLDKAAPSFSLYSPEVERKLQYYFWSLAAVTFMISGGWIWSLYYCSSHHLGFICYMTNYSWSLTHFLLAGTCICAMILHYGDEETNRKAADYQTGAFYDVHVGDYLDSDPQDSLD